MESNKKKNILMIIVIFVILLTLSGSTFAFWNWTSLEGDKTNIVFILEEGYSCAASADGGGDIESGDVIIAPAPCTKSKYVIKRELTIMPTVEETNAAVDMKLWLNIEQMDAGLSESKNFRYVVTTSSSSCSDGIVSSGNFNGVTAGDQVEIFSKSYSSSGPRKYYLYIWLDEAETNPNTISQHFKMSLGGNCTSQATIKPEVPALDTGLIPVKLSSDGTVTTVSSTDSSWYDYRSQEWANAILVDDDSRDTYQDTSGEIVDEEDILAYYVWIPRYRYKIANKCSDIPEKERNINDYPECYAPYTMSDEDKNKLVMYYEGEETCTGSQEDLEFAEEEVNIGLAGGSIYSSYYSSITKYVEAYNSGKVNDCGSPSGLITLNASGFNGNNSITIERPINIEFESQSSEYQEGDAVKTYRTHPAFWWDNNSNGSIDSGEMLAGLWVGKFETSANTDSTCYTSASEENCMSSNVSPRIVPNEKSLRYQNVSNQFETSRKFSTSGNIYGLSNKNIDAHVMKNSEWGAVAYLSHSVYGIDDEIRANKSSSHITGCGVSSDASAQCQIPYNSEYTPQSTTGNITGIFDMSGGYNENLMGVLADDDGNPRSGDDSSNNSGFNGLLSDDTQYTLGINFPSSKYYDLYMTDNPLTACNGGPCYGHALYETAGWYGDVDNFVDSGKPWLYRGGYFYTSNDGVGIFFSAARTGHASANFSWRSVLVSTGVVQVNLDLTYTKSYTSAKEHVLTIPYSGVYQLEVWGAQGGDRGGYGGYSKGVINLNADEKLYVNVGGRGGSINSWGQVAGGYNGGGTAFGVRYKVSGAGGGATHIAKVSGTLSTLSSSRDDILIVAGGGGGGYSEDGTYYGQGGHGGGIKGTNGYLRTSFSSTGPGGSQTSGGGGGVFGQGANATVEDYFGGGGGWYGGALGNYTGAAGGGSGYIGNSLLTDKEMYCYSCTTSSNVDTLTYSTTNVSETATSKYAKTGNGAAKISLISSYKTLQYGATYGYLPVLSKSGYTFLGWYTEPDGGKQITSDTIVSIKHEHTLYPRWASNT